MTGSTTRGDGGQGANARQEAAVVDDLAAGIGAFIGGRRHFDPGIVVGVEFDLARLGHRAENVDLIRNTAIPSASLVYQTQWLGTARMTLGWSLGDVLVYGTGGAAFAADQARRTQYRVVGGTAQAMFTEEDAALRTGYAIGAGAELRLPERPWSLRAEYLHVRLADRDFSFPDARGGAQASFTSVQGRIADNKGHMNLARIGIAFTF